MARRLGARVYALPEDIVEVRIMLGNNNHDNLNVCFRTFLIGLFYCLYFRYAFMIDIN